MKNSEKLAAVMRFLQENNIKYVLNSKGEGHCNLWVPVHRIAIKMTGDDDALFYDTHRRTCFPLFIRTDETVEFVIEKVQNTIVKSMKKAQEQLLLKQEKAERKKKTAERIAKQAAKRRADKEVLHKKKAASMPRNISRNKSYDKDNVAIKPRRKRMRVRISHDWTSRHEKPSER